MRTQAAIKQNRRSIGELSYELIKKDTNSLPVRDLTDEMNKKNDKMQLIWDAVNAGKDLYEGDFYVVYLRKKELLTPNVVRNYFFPRKSCPTPTYHQSVFKYYRKDNKLELLWTLPSQDAVQYYLHNRLTIPPSQMQVLKYVLEFWDGTLDRFTQEENKETFYDPGFEYR